MLHVAAHDRLRVLLYHDVPPELEERFADQIRSLARRWTFVTPERFTAMVQGDEPVRGSNVLLTFDDGFLSNRAIAERVLNPLGIRAIFFVISDFVDAGDREEAHRFIAHHIERQPKADVHPPHLRNMRWNDLSALLAQGHTIGGHTRTHAMLSRLRTEGELREEIVGSADRLAERLGAPIEHFAYTFGDIASFSADAMRVAKHRFRCIYSGLRGDNVGAPPAALRRDAVAAHESNALVGAFLEGAADFHYASGRALIDSWI